MLNFSIHDKNWAENTFQVYDSFGDKNDEA